jgi:alanyl-tRNA synthetase
MTLTEAAGLFSAHIYDVPQQVRKSVDESKTAGKAQHRLLEELAEFHAGKMLAEGTGNPLVITAVFPERDALFIKLLAQKLTAGGTRVIALLAAGAGPPTLVFAQSSAPQADSALAKPNMGQLLKDAMTQLGGRGGGTADMAQGGLPAATNNLAAIEKALRDTAAKL